MRMTWEILRLALESLRERKTRTFLTVLMVASGCSLMIALKGMTAGFSGFIDFQFSKLAPNILFVSNNSESVSDDYFSDQVTHNRQLLTNNVASRIGSLPLASEVLPIYRGPVAISSRNKKNDTTIFSIDPSKLSAIAPTLTLQPGSTIRSTDPSAILLPQSIAQPNGATVFAETGQTVKLTYQSISPTSGKTLDVSRSFVVSGIIMETGNPNLDNSVVINHVACRALFQKAEHYDGLVVAARTPDVVPNLKQDIQAMYGSQLKITTPKTVLQTLGGFIDAFSTFTNSTSIIALLVGAVGIVTTLYTSVTERTREIGTLKAVGAGSQFVLSLFLAEAIIIALAGALVGIALGVVGGHALIARFAASQPDLVPVFLFKDIAIVGTFTIALGLVAGIYPAWLAARIPPMSALRRE